MPVGEFGDSNDREVVAATECGHKAVVGSESTRGPIVLGLFDECFDTQFVSSTSDTSGHRAVHSLRVLQALGGEQSGAVATDLGLPAPLEEGKGDRHRRLADYGVHRASE